MTCRKVRSQLPVSGAPRVCGGLLLASGSSAASVGVVRTESRPVELADAEPVRDEIDFSAGDLELTGAAERLLEAGFIYDAAKQKPGVAYAEGTLHMWQPGAE